MLSKYLILLRMPFRSFYCYCIIVFNDYRENHQSGKISVMSVAARKHSHFIHLNAVYITEHTDKILKSFTSKFV